jgi:hypothetical protein
MAYSLGAFAAAGRFTAAPGCAVLDSTIIAPVFADGGPAPKVEASEDNCTATDGKVQINVPRDPAGGLSIRSSRVN